MFFDDILNYISTAIMLFALKDFNSSNKNFISFFILDAGIKEAVKTDKAPAALGPYSQAIKAKDTVFVSGVLGLIPEV